MKRAKKFLSAILAVLCCLQSAAALADDVKIKMDGREIYCDQPPIIIDGTTLVPLRAVSEEMGYEVSWNQSLQMVDIIDNGKGGGAGITLYIGSTIVETGGGVKEIPVAPIIVNNRTMVPIRVIAETLLCDVNWDGANRTVVITSGYRPSDYMY